MRPSIVFLFFYFLGTFSPSGTPTLQIKASKMACRTFWGCARVTTALTAATPSLKSCRTRSVTMMAAEVHHCYRIPSITYWKYHQNNRDNDRRKKLVFWCLQVSSCHLWRANDMISGAAHSALQQNQSHRARQHSPAYRCPSSGSDCARRRKRRCVRMWRRCIALSV